MKIVVTPQNQNNLFQRKNKNRLRPISGSKISSGAWLGAGEAWFMGSIRFLVKKKSKETSTTTELLTSNTTAVYTF